MADKNTPLFSGYSPKIKNQENHSYFAAHIFADGKWQRHRVGISKTTTLPTVFTLDVSFLDGDTATLG